MKPVALLVASFTLVALATPARAQSLGDKRKSLVGVTVVGFQETGVAGLGGGTAGSPYLLQAEERMRAVGLPLVELEKAHAAGQPLYEVFCTSMDGADGDLRVACESRFLRRVYLKNAESAQDIYAVTWTSPLVIASVPRDRKSDVEKITGTLVDAFVADWSAANPGAPKPGKAAKKK